jgi:hypothetical protein
MIRKFATVSRFRVVVALMSLVTILAGAATVRAQQTPAEQTPAQQPTAQPAPAQQPDNHTTNQETSPEESTSMRRLKPREYKNWNFNAAVGANNTTGTTKLFARGGGLVGDAGVARNYSKYFGLRADFQFDNLPLRNSALGLAQAPSATSYVYSVMAGPIINIPVTKDWGGYLVFGPDYLHRGGKLDSSTAIPGAGCNTFFIWWGACLSNSLPTNGKFLSASQNDYGYYFGGGVTRKLRPHLEIYAEYRLVHGKQGSITTDFRPITLGLRW